MEHHGGGGMGHYDSGHHHHHHHEVSSTPYLPLGEVPGVAGAGSRPSKFGWVILLAMGVIGLALLWILAG